MRFSSEATSSGCGLDANAPLLPSVAGSDYHGRRLSSQPKTFANVFIAIVGAGVLGLPYAFRRTGWAAGAILLLAVAALSFHCMMLLVRTRRQLNLEHSAKIASFGDLGLAVAGPLGRLAVDAMIVLSQAGFCIGYLIFISNSFTHLLPASLTFLPFLSSNAIYVLTMLPFQLGLNSIQTLTLLAPLSIFADVVDIGAMGVVIAEDVSIMLSSPPPLNAFSGPSVLLYGIGVAVYAFEGVGMVIPLEAEAADKPKFGRTLGLSMAFIALLYGLFGVLGYAAFGEETRDIITTNLGVAERWVCGKRYCWWLRWAVVVAVSLVATLVPNFADFLSLVGSSVCVVLGFVLPALFHLKVFGSELGWAGATVDIAILIIGLTLAISGTWSSLMTIFNSVQLDRVLIRNGSIGIKLNQLFPLSRS
uniref:Amino acid transporter transmembrane domain-containing protein n=1 Tax=Musa acuminata subsp. malaccensis TaxID=214687 RepID=A0A804J6H1_MUSAM